MVRADDFELRRKHLANLSEEELKQRFWELAGRIADPLLELARTHTSPSIERSILMRMGFSSLESQAIVKQCMDRGVMGKGAGNLVWRLSRIKDIPVHQAGLQLSQGQGWNELHLGEE